MEHILKWFTDLGDGNSLKYVTWFSSKFTPTDFGGLDALFACFLQYCAKLKVTPCQKFLDVYLRIDCKSDIKKYNIKPEDNDGYDYTQISHLDNAYEVIKTTASNLFDIYMQEDLSDRDFKVDMYQYMCEVKAIKITEAINSIAPNLSNGIDIDKSSENLRAKLKRIEETYSIKSLEELDSVRADGEKITLVKVAETGIPAIDGDVGGIYTHLIYTLNAQPGGGKTRFGIAHFILKTMLAGFGVIMYSTELTESQVKNIITAYYIAIKFGKKVPDQLMNIDKLNSEQRALYDTAQVELFESGKFGNLYIIEDCVVEDMQSKVEALVQTDSNIRLLAIDYMGLMESKPVEKVKKLVGFEIITEGYITVRKLVKEHELSALCVNQYNDAGIDAAFAGKPIRSGHIQGGHIVHRHTDYDLSITYTEEQELAGLRTLSNTKTRGSGGFKPVQLKVDLSVSMFKQEVV